MEECGLNIEFGVRFRQHLEKEMAHYADDCWDAEILTSYGWVECIGIADRSAFDLKCHEVGTKKPMKASRLLNKEQQRKETQLTLNLDKGLIGKTWGKEAKEVLLHFEEMTNQDKVALKEFDELGIAAAQFGTVESRNERRQPVKVTVNTRASFSSAKRLLTAGEPLASGRPSNILIGPGYSSIGLSPVKRLNIGENYQTVGAESSVSISSLQNSEWVFPELITAAYAQVSEHVDNDINNLSETITSGSSTPYEATRRVENYLRSNYLFSLSNTKVNPRSDIVSVFLFETRQGHFDHFASAMVMLLRAIEIPARITVGFILDDSSFNPATKNFELSDKQAWAWPQVYFENLGWIDFNPTPSRDLIMRSDQSQGDKNLLASRSLGASNSFMYDDAELLDMFAEFEVESEIENAFQLEDRNGIAEFLLGIFFRSLVLVFLVGLVAALIFRFLWIRQFRDYQGAIATWRKLEFWLRVSGTYPYQNLTALETAEYLSFLNLSDTLIQEFAREYSRALYSGHDLHTGSEAQQQFVATYRLIRRALIVWRMKSSGRKILEFWRVGGAKAE